MTTPDPSADGLIDLVAARSARREGKATNVRVRVDDGEPILLPVELPLDVLGPLHWLIKDKDVSVMFLARSAGMAEQMLRDLVATRSDLGPQLLRRGQLVLERLFCADFVAGSEDGCRVGDPDADEGSAAYQSHHVAGCAWTRLQAARLSTPDYVQMFKGLWAQYGATLGEAFSSSASSGNGGETSKRTSPGTTTSTRARAGGRRTAKASSASAG